MSLQTMSVEEEAEVVEQIRQGRDQILAELAKTIVGQRQVVEQLLVCLFAGGHCLITGAPGLAKTLLVRSVAQVFHLKFQRIQFTPDLMPADITGTEILSQDADGSRQLQFVKGPIFANVILADEINRTPPKTQAALLEAMQEHQVTAAGTRYPLDEPFFVLATQNPIEMEGTYPLPEAQLDRFLFNIQIEYLPPEDELSVVLRTTSSTPESIQPLFSGQDVIRFHQAVRKVPIADEVAAYAVRLAAATRPGQAGTADFVNDWIAWGAGTRAAQTLVLCGKARALLQGRAHVSRDDIRALAHPALRHRVILSYKAEAEGVTVENVIDRLLEIKFT
jgi:MoxR-like ATPase